MEWINIFGVVFVAIIMIPNIIYALRVKNGFENKWNYEQVYIANYCSGDICTRTYIDFV